MTGWIKLSRRITDNPLYFGERFNHMQCLLDLMLLAEWKEKRTFFVRSIKVELKKGQLAMPVRDLAERWNMTQLTVLKRLNELEEAGLISIKRSKTINVITIDSSLFDSNSETETGPARDREHKAHSEVQNETENIAENKALSEAETEAQSKALSLRNNKNIKKDKNTNNAHACEQGDAGDNFLKAFFAEEKRSSIEQLCMSWHLTEAQLKAIARECVMEWKLTGEKFGDDFTTLARRLLQHMRAKQKYSHDGGIKISDAPEGTVNIVDVDGQTVYLGKDEFIHPDGFRTYCRSGEHVPLAAPPRPGKGWWWQPITNSWCDLP